MQVAGTDWIGLDNKDYACIQVDGVAGERERGAVNTSPN